MIITEVKEGTTTTLVIKDKDNNVKGVCIVDTNHRKYWRKYAKKSIPEYIE